MGSNIKNPPQITRLHLYVVLLAVIWTLANGASLLWSLFQNHQEIYNLALVTAKINYDKDILYRLWVSSHGGVYVPASSLTPPNPYLAHIPERDLMTPSGRSLTLVNPAYMTRQVHELGHREYGIQGHITSLNPIRPENAPDAWETEALKAFELGQKEFSGLAELKGEPYLRLMRPFRVDKGCLKCHAGQGYKEGDIRGGVSLSVPLGPLQEAKRRTTNMLWWSHSLVWLLGLSVILGGSRRLQHSLKEQIQTQKELSESEERYRTLVENVDFGIALIDPDFKIILANASFGKMYGQPLSDIIGQECFRMKKRENEVCQDCPGREAMATGQPVAGTGMGVRKDGTSFPMHLNTFPHYDESGRLMGFIEITEDISDKQRLEDELLKARKLEAAGILAGGIAHDFNNLFGLILGNISMARTNMEPDNKARLPLLEAERAIVHATDLTKKFIAFSAASASAKSVISLQQIVSEVVAQTLSGANIAVEYSWPEELGPVAGDAGQISQAISNIVLNAREAMPGGGMIKIVGSNIGLGSGYFTPEPKMPAGRGVKISITDQGSGISADNLSKIFDPYFSTKDIFSQKGLGLGLSLAYAYIKKNGGNITVESEVGRGTTFNIYLPVSGDLNEDKIKDL